MHARTQNLEHYGVIRTVLRMIKKLRRQTMKDEVEKRTTEKDGLQIIIKRQEDNHILNILRL